MVNCCSAFCSAFCSVLQCVAVCCSALQYVAVCRSVSQCVAVCCIVWQCVAMCCNVLQCVAMCCNVLQCCATCCIVSQRVAGVFKGVRHSNSKFQSEGKYLCVLVCHRTCIFKISFTLLVIYTLLHHYKVMMYIFRT